MFQNEVKHVVLMPSSTNLGINKEVTHNTRQNNKIVGTQYREIQTTKVENFDPSLWKLVTLGVQILRRLHYFLMSKSTYILATVNVKTSTNLLRPSKELRSKRLKNSLLVNVINSVSIIFRLNRCFFIG